MGFISKETVDKVKALADKNKAKIASGVNKATDTIDKKTGGKHTDKLKKVDDAAKKFAGSPDDAAGATPPADGDASEPTAGDPATDAEQTAD